MLLKHPYLGEYEVTETEKVGKYVLFQNLQGAQEIQLWLCRELTPSERQHWAGINDINYQLMFLPFSRNGEFNGRPYGPDIFELFSDAEKTTNRQFIFLNETPITSKSDVKLILQKLFAVKKTPRGVKIIGYKFGLREKGFKWWGKLLLRDILVDLG